MDKPLIYLASPYTHPLQIIMNSRFDLVVEAAAGLVKQGHLVFSPIAHSHPMAEYGVKTSFEDWVEFDFRMLEACDELWVLKIAGHRESIGVAAEIEDALQSNKPVKFITFEEAVNETAEELL